MSEITIGPHDPASCVDFVEGYRDLVDVIKHEIKAGVPERPSISDSSIYIYGRMGTIERILTGVYLELLIELKEGR